MVIAQKRHAPGARKISRPFNLEELHEEWAESLKRVSAPQFRKGGNRICLPLSAGERWLGCAILADRVNGLPSDRGNGSAQVHRGSDRREPVEPSVDG